MTALIVLGLILGYVLGRSQPVARWRRHVEREVRFGTWTDRKHLLPLAAQFCVAHPVRSWRAWRRPEQDERPSAPDIDMRMFRRPDAGEVSR